MTKPSLTGNALKQAVESEIPPRNPLIENLVYEKSVIMVYADPGVGKSVASLLMALQASNGLPVFGFFEPVRPLKVYYVMTERGVEEPIERIQLMMKAQHFNFDNLYLDETLIGIDVLEKEDEEKLIAQIEANCPKPDIIVFDPIYAMVRGGLSKPDDATLFAQFSARVQAHFKCANWLNHHTLKSLGSFVDGAGWVEKDDPFFGSQLLKAHITGSYYMTQKDHKSHFQCKKDSHSCLIRKFSLKFDQETYMLNMEIDSSDISSKDKSRLFLNKCKKEGKRFNFDQFHAAIQPCSARYTSKLLGVTVKEGLIFNVSGKFSNALYEVL